MAVDGAYGSNISTGGNAGQASAMSTAIIEFFTLPQGVPINFTGAAGSPSQTDLLNAFNAMVTQLQTQITTPVLARIQTFSAGGS